MAENLTREQRYFARRQFARWIRVRLEHEVCGKGRVIDKMSEQDWVQLMADIEHSPLLLRLLSGKDPLPEPPPLAHGYPNYKAVEEDSDD